MKRCGLLAVSFVSVCGPWLAMIAIRYRDPTGLSAHLGVINNPQADLFRVEALRGMLTSDFARAVPGYVAAALTSQWGVFGVHNILAPSGVYALFNSLALLGLVGYAASLLRPSYQRGPTGRRWELWLVGWLVLHVITLVLWAVRSGGGPGRLLFPALPAIALVLAAGWPRLSHWSRYRPLSHAVRSLHPALPGL